jgi:hypothetical protein
LSLPFLITDGCRTLDDLRDSEFAHYIFTRFNVRYSDSAALASDDWLRKRLQIFQRFTLQSMRAQTIQPHRWLILCDTHSPQWLREALDALLRPPERAVWLPGPFNERAAARLVGAPETPYLITTRIDNDDAVADDFVATVQLAFKWQDFEFVNLPRGVQMQGGRFYRRSDPSNAFISLVERRHNRPPRTVWIDQHQVLAKHGPIRQVSTRHPMWLQNVHGENLQNAVHGIRLSPRSVVPHFAINAEHVDVPAFSLALDTVRTTMALAFRIIRKPARIRWLLRVIRP